MGLTQKHAKSLTSALLDLKQQIAISSSETKEIPDIVTFCEDPEWLGLANHPTNPIAMYPVQKLVLKAFYRGSIGNENLVLTEEEIEVCKKLGLINSDKGNLLEKYESGELFNELILVWGRRSGKDFTVAILALYEAMKILECPGGDPYSLYEISSANSINILTVANSAKQAQLAFQEIKDKIMYSPYFRDKYLSDGITSSSVYLLTPQDKEDNKNFKSKVLPLKKGSVCVVVGHSNSDTLLGMGCIVLILDEMASYKTTGGASSGDRIYAALTPTLSTYCRKTYKLDGSGDFVREENGQRIVEKREYDGKVIGISSPRGKEGKFYNLFVGSPDAPRRLVCRLATWEVNPTHTKESLRREHLDMSEQEFMMEFGAEFSGLAGESFFLEEQVEDCFYGNLEIKEHGEAGFVYFVHLDPATSSHNYALVVVHKERYLDKEKNESNFVIVVDHIKCWYPTKENPINPIEIDNYVLGLKRRFYLGMLTYDQWNEQRAILKLKNAGIPNKKTQFTNRYKNIIYGELEQLVMTRRLLIPHYHLLRQEMLELQRKFNATGFKVSPKTDGEGAKSDDVCDALAGACYIAINHEVKKLPHGRTVEMPAFANNQNIVWRSMQGTPYGVGPGQVVAKQLENRNSWPRYKR